MPCFHFVAADSSGAVSDGAIDAATAADPRNKLAANGLAVRPQSTTCR
jgi:type II secretory pathway component PulF